MEYFLIEWSWYGGEWRPKLVKAKDEWEAMAAFEKHYMEENWRRYVKKFLGRDDPDQLAKDYVYAHIETRCSGTLIAENT